MTPSVSRKKRVALVLSGAVAKGAYEAGVLEVISQCEDIQVTRIVGASAGALNAAYYGCAIRQGDERAGATNLVKLWRFDANFRDVFSLDLSSLVARIGLSGHDKLRGLLSAYIQPTSAPALNPINIRLVVSPLDGVSVERRERLAEKDDGVDPTRPRTQRTTYEHLCEFDETTFERRESVDDLITAAVASASFPGAFVPVAIPGVGRCIDGGSVNNTPIKWAVGGAIGDALDAVFVISPTDEYKTASTADLRGLAFIDHVVSMLIDERLYRDLREAEQVNNQLRALEALNLSVETLHAVKKAIGWDKMIPLDIVQIRPTEALPGHAFAGFRHPGLRDEYVDIGRACARDEIANWRSRTS